MNTTVERKFQVIGARVKIAEAQDTRWRVSSPFRIDIGRDKEGEFFDIQVKKEVEMLVLDAQKDDRHLLLFVKDSSPKQERDRRTGELKMVKPMEPDKFRFLCGHDERNWFTCAIPGNASSVFQAKQALKPTILREIESREGVKANRAQKRHRRLNSGRKIHRQGEFMFIPDENYQPPKGFTTIILRHEPMTRGNSRVGNAHFAEYLYRSGGVQVYVSRVAPNGYTERQYQDWLKSHPGDKSIHWNSMTRDPVVWVKGKITHKEHRTLDLGHIWHRVVVNTENNAPGARQVAFLD